MAIESFRDNYYFLSNMCPVPGGIETPDGIAGTVEHAYQAAKFPTNDGDARLSVLGAATGVKAKRKAARLVSSGHEIRPDWEEVKLDTMRGLVRQKFEDAGLADRLLATGGTELIEGNERGDNFWGVSPPGNPEGLNWLGRILMDTRDELRAVNSSNS